MNQGLRDIWEAIILTGRRCSEVLNLRLDCIGRYGGLAMLWHDQTKVGNYNQAIRIPEHLFELLAERQRKTLARFEDRHGRQPTPAQRARMALFPSRICNPNGQMALSYRGFTVGSSYGSTSSTSDPWSHTKPVTPWPPTCFATAPAWPTSAATSARSPTGWPSTTSTSPTRTWRTSSTTCGSPAPARRTRASCSPAPHGRHPADDP